MAEDACRHGAGEEKTPKMVEETDRRKLQSEEFHNLYLSQYIIMRFKSKMDGACGIKGREGNFM